MTKLEAIEGIGDVYATKLREVGIPDLEALLVACKTPEQRQALAQKADISGKLILEWANRADLFRIKGIGEEYSDLLEAAGVDTVVELAQRKPDNLLAKMHEVNEAKKLVRRLPSLDQVTAWVGQAKELPRALTY